MKIERYDVFPLLAPYIRPGTPPGHPSNGTRNCVLLRLTTDTGLQGWGEAYAGCYATEVTVAALRRYQPSVMLGNPAEPDRLMEDVRFRNRYWAMRGLGAGAASAIESAVWDLHAQLQGKPLWKLLGGGRGEPVTAYASAGDTVLSPEEVAAQVRAFRDLGYRAYKMRAGGRYTDPVVPDRIASDRLRVEAARRALGDGLLGVDLTVPQRPLAWRLDYTEQFLRALAPFALAFVEEPAMTYDLAAWVGLQRLGIVALAGGESFTAPDEFDLFLDQRAFDVVQPDATVVGGPASCVAVCRKAAELDLAVCPHAWCGGVGMAQNLHAAWACAGVLAVEFPMASHDLFGVPLAPLLDFRQGLLHPSPQPGLGVSCTDEFLERYRWRSGGERDF